MKKPPGAAAARTTGKEISMFPPRGVYAKRGHCITLLFDYRDQNCLHLYPGGAQEDAS